MKVDCGWIEQNVESYFCDKLTVEEGRLARLHLENCAKCREEIQGFSAIDPLLRNYFRNQLLIAQNRKRRPIAVIYGGVAATAIAALLLVAILLRVPDVGGPVSNPSQPLVVGAPEVGPPSIPIIKDEPSVEITRAKPGAPAPSVDNAATATVGSSDEITPDGPEFQVIDTSGYSRTLRDFRGYTLVFGVWSDGDAGSINAMEHIYRAFGTNTQLRILGVSHRRAPKPPGTTFPIAYNQGSRLLNARAGEMVVVDVTGAVRFRGSLLTPPDDAVKNLQTALEALGIR